NDLRAQQRKAPVTLAAIQRKEVVLADHVRMTLEDPSGRVRIDTIAQHRSTRPFSPEHDERWTWTVAPNKGEGGKADVILFLTVTTMDSLNTLHGDPFRKQFALRIALPESLWQAFKRAALDIRWLFGIIGSVVGFFLGLRKGKQAHPA